MDTEEKDGIFLLFICIWSVAYCVYIYLYMTGRVWPTIGQGTNEALSQAYMLALALVVCAFVQKYLQRILEKMYPPAPSGWWVLIDTVSSFLPLAVAAFALVVMMFVRDSYFSWFNYQRLFAFGVVLMSVIDDIMPTYRRIHTRLSSS